MMAGASPSAAMRPEFYFVRAASWASDRAIRPAANGQIVNAVVGIREVNNCFLQALWFAHGLALHEQNHTLNAWWSQVSNCQNYKQVHTDPMTPAEQSPDQSV